MVSAHAPPQVATCYCMVILPPSFDPITSTVNRYKLVGVQALVSQPTVERLDRAVVRGRSRAAEVQLDAVLPGPFVKGFRGELRAVVDTDRFRQRSGL
ncbi:hypothetical protein D9M68_961850 [compost metagenome]